MAGVGLPTSRATSSDWSRAPPATAAPSCTQAATLCRQAATLCTQAATPCIQAATVYVPRCAACDGSDDVDALGVGPITDGAGYVVLSSARRRRGLQHAGRSERSAASAALPPQPLRRRAAVANRRVLAEEAWPGSAMHPPYSAAYHPRRALAEEEGTCCGSIVGSDAFYGDANGDCVFDIKP